MAGFFRGRGFRLDDLALAYGSTQISHFSPQLFKLFARLSRLLEGDQPLLVAKTVLLELEWVMRGVYASTAAQFAGAVEHLLSLPHVTVEDRLSIEAALTAHRAGLDFADALHHATYRVCDAIATFDDRRFARRANKLGLAPAVTIPR